MHPTEKIIDEIVESVFEGRYGRARYVMRESLHSLVRLAKAEQLLDIRKSGVKMKRQSGKKLSLASHSAG